MITIKHFIEKRAVLAYFALTIILTWGCMWLAVYPDGFPITDEQFETAGALVYVAMLVGPTAAGLLLTGLLEGRQGFRKLFSGLVRWKVNVRWYAIVLLTAPVLIMVILYGLSLISSDFQPAIFKQGDKLTLVLSSIAAGLAVGFFEELGWTGFAVPRLRLRFSVLNTGLIVGLVWGLWHFPPFWTSDTFSAALPFILLLGQLLSWLPPYRILMVWVYDRTGSLLLAVLMHASLMGSLNALVPAELSGTTLITWIYSWAAALWLILGVGFAIKGRWFSSQPGRKQAISKL